MILTNAQIISFTVFFFSTTGLTNLIREHFFEELADASDRLNKVKLSRYTPWRHMGAEEV
jgi:hypothetical protein